MTSNPILDEIHATRQELLAEHNGDLHAYVEAARKRAITSGRQIVQPKQRTNHCIEVADQPQSDGKPVPSTR
jgi:hypothetical protein